MERLTNKKEADSQRREYENRLRNGYPRNIPEERFLCLAAYEDTGLEPEEIDSVFINAVIEENKRLKEELAGLQVSPNPPLTLNELREMDGCPVWCVGWDGNGCWCLVEAKDDTPSAQGLDGLYFWGGFYGELAHNMGRSHRTWYAYRRKPEEGGEVNNTSRSRVEGV